jgi:hypothetical protein
MKISCHLYKIKFSCLRKKVEDTHKERDYHAALRQQILGLRHEYSNEQGNCQSYQALKKETARCKEIGVS